MDWVGLVDFYHESICLLLSRLPLNDTGTGNGECYALKCGCTPEGNPWGSGDFDVRVDHGHVNSEVPLTPKLREMIDRLTEVDRSLFLVALRTFFVETARLENRLGRRVLCNSEEALRDRGLGRALP